MQPKNLELPFVNREASINDMCEAWLLTTASAGAKSHLPVASHHFGSGKTYLGQHIQYAVSKRDAATWAYRKQCESPFVTPIIYALLLVVHQCACNVRYWYVELKGV